MKRYPSKIVIVDDHPLILEGIKTVIQSFNWGSVIKVYSSGGDCLKNIEHDCAELYLLDLQLGVTDGKQLIKPIKDNNHQTKVVMLSSFDNEEVIKKSLKQGADAYIIKNVSFNELCDALLLIWTDTKFSLPYVFTKQAIVVSNNVGKQAVPRLTEREVVVLKLILEEKTTKEIANTLCLSDKTIEAHRASLFLKFDVKNIAGLVKKAIDWGI